LKNYCEEPITKRNCDLPPPQLQLTVQGSKNHYRRFKALSDSENSSRVIRESALVITGGSGVRGRARRVWAEQYGNQESSYSTGSGGRRRNQESPTLGRSLAPRQREPLHFYSKCIYFNGLIQY
jgi:hypothetical protein